MADSTVKSEEITPPKKMLYVWVENLRVRESATTKSEILTEVGENTMLFYLNEETEKKDKIYLRGKLYNESWLKVETADGTVGWVYGGAVTFEEPLLDVRPNPYDDCFELLKDKKISAYEKCYKNVSERVTRADRRYIRENDRGFEVHLLNGERRLLEEGRNISYQYLYYLPKMSFFVFEKTVNDSSSYLLVNDKSGRIRNLRGFPKAAPDNKYLVTLNANMNATDDSNGIDIYGYTENGFEKIFTKTVFDFEPTYLKWVEDRVADIYALPHQADIRGKVKIFKLRQGTNEKWTME